MELAPKLHSSPLVWSQGCVLLQSSLSCLAQTLQQPQPSRTNPTPGAHLGASRGQWQAAGQVESAWKGEKKRMRLLFTASRRRLNYFGCGAPSTGSLDPIPPARPPRCCAPGRGLPDTSSGLKATASSKLLSLTFPSVKDQGPEKEIGEGGQGSGDLKKRKEMPNSPAWSSGEE